MKIILLCAVLIVGIDGKISVTKVDSETNPELAKAVTRVEQNSDGVGTLTVELEILKTIDGKIMVRNYRLCVNRLHDLSSGTDRNQP
jgi:hypothetical protein